MQMMESEVYYKVHQRVKVSRLTVINTNMYVFSTAAGLAQLGDLSSLSTIFVSIIKKYSEVVTKEK